MTPDRRLLLLGWNLHLRHLAGEIAGFERLVGPAQKCRRGRHEAASAACLPDFVGGTIGVLSPNRGIVR
jgi:hypothetical protein